LAKVDGWAELLAAATSDPKTVVGGSFSVTFGNKKSYACVLEDFDAEAKTFVCKFKTGSTYTFSGTGEVVKSAKGYFKAGHQTLDVASIVPEVSVPMITDS
jgi:hypothetical protein